MRVETVAQWQARTGMKAGHATRARLRETAIRAKAIEAYHLLKDGCPPWTDANGNTITILGVGKS